METHKNKVFGVPKHEALSICRYMNHKVMEDLKGVGFTGSLEGKMGKRLKASLTEY